MKATRSLPIIGLMLVLLMAALVPQVSMARRPHPTPTPTPVALKAPTLISPANGATVAGNINFSWSVVAGAARYHIQAGLGTAFDGQSNIIENWSLTSPAYTFTVNPGFAVYFPHLYWRVQAIDANNVAGPWSQVGSLIIAK